MTQQKARELLNEARRDIDAGWSESKEEWRPAAVPFLLTAIAESIMALTEAILELDPKDDEKLLEKLRIEGRR